MRNPLIVFVCLILVATLNGAKLPSSFKKCNKSSKDFNECLSTAVHDALKQLTRPFKEVNLPSLEPLEIPSLTIGAGTGPVGLEQRYKNAKIYGFTKPSTTKFQIDLEKKVAKIENNFPELKMLADYDVRGKILLLAVYGKGPTTLSMENLNGIVDFTLDYYEKNGKKHLKAVNAKITLNPGLVKYNFENLADGNKALGDSINKVLNENWQEVFNDVKSGYEEAFAQIAVRYLNNVLEKVPFDELFDG